MELNKITTGFLNNNTFAVSKNDTTILIDPGFETKQIDDWLENSGLVPNVILVTHGHFDHAGGVKFFQDKYGSQVIFDKEDHFYLEDPFGPLESAGLELEMSLDLDFKYTSVNDGQILNFNGVEITVIKTPGHTPGSVCYLFKEINTLFTGDTLFKGTIGRTDFQKSDFEEITKSIQEKLYNLDCDLIVMPGHGKSTAIGQEKNNNKIIKGK